MWQVVGYVGLGLKRPFWKLHVKFAKAKLGSLHADLTPPNLHDSLSDLQSCGATFPWGPLAYIILGGVGAGGGYYIGDTYFTSNSTNITQSNGTIFDTTNARKLFSIPFDDPVSYEVKTEYMLVYGLVLSIGLALIIVAFITYKNRQKISRRFEYENI